MQEFKFPPSIIESKHEMLVKFQGLNMLNSDFS